MLTRKLQATGGSSLSLTLPKKWAVKHHLADKDRVKLTEFKNGNLLISSVIDNQHLNQILAIDHDNIINLKRYIYSSYVAGIDNLQINWAELTSQQKALVSGLIRNLIGWEVEQETSQLIRTFYILDYQKMPPTKVMQKLLLLTCAMLEDLSASDFNFDLSDEIIKRDDEADRLNIFFDRLFFSLVAGKIDEEVINLRSDQLLYWSAISNQLERICDHVAHIASRAKTQPQTLSVYQTTIEQIITLLAEIQDCLFDGTTNPNSISQYLADSQEYLAKTIAHKSSRLMIDNSFGRIYDYIDNIIDSLIALELIN